MIFEKIQKQLCGYVEFRAIGGFPERFINLCSKNNINISEVRMYKQGIYGICDIASYRKIRPVSRKSGMKVNIIKRHGLPFLLYKNRKRTGIAVGFVLFTVITMLLSGRIWTVEVNGNEKIPDEIILESYEKLGIKPGIKKGSVNSKEISLKALTEIDSLMWNAVNIDGCCITVEVKERLEKIIKDEDETPCNIVASFPGQIIRVENFSGTQIIESGSAVEKGDVIISGAVINRDESVNFYKAEANVLARTKRTVEKRENSVRQMRVYKKVKNNYFLNFFTAEIPLWFLKSKGDNCDFYRDENFLSSSDVKLPLGIITERRAFFDEEKIRLKESAVRLICIEKYFREVDEDFNEREIENSKTEITQNKNFCIVKTDFRCVENIAESKNMDISFEEDFF